MSEPSPTPENTQETFISHLIELRSRLLRSIIAVVVVLVCLFPWAKDIYAALAAPLLKALPHGSTMIATDVTGTFLVPLKVTLMAAFLIALPYVLYQIWAFVAPGLYHHEKRLALPVIFSSVVFFALGFFFQAEDGIRDLYVTGVQTCALPICCRSWPARQSRLLPRRRR